MVANRSAWKQLNSSYTCKVFTLILASCLCFHRLCVCVPRANKNSASTSQTLPEFNLFCKSRNAQIIKEIAPG